MKNEFETTRVDYKHYYSTAPGTVDERLLNSYLYLTPS